MSFQDNIPSQPPRPPNAFLCFRSRFIREQKASHARGAKGSMMQDISRQAAHRWNGMSEEERRPYFDMALRMREEHRVTYPDYKFTPSKRGSGKSAGHRAQASRRRAQATGGPKEPEPGQSSFMAYFYHDDSHPMPTLSSPYTPPPVEDRLYRSEDSLYSRATSMSNSAGRNENSKFPYARSDRPESWDRNPPQFGTSDGSLNPRDFSPSSRLSPHGSREGFYHSFETQTAPASESQHDFASLCQWDQDFSGSHTASTNSTYYRPY